MCSHSSYGGRLVNLMLSKESVFVQFRSCYYLLYQCLVPNTREALSLLVQHYSVPKDFERSILSGENPRVCNQGILNYLLIKLRTDKNFVKFWSSLAAMIKHPELRIMVDQLRKQKFLSGIAKLPSNVCAGVTKEDDLESAFPAEEGALSVTDCGDDYCVSYTVTMVDVRSCTRPSRLPGPSYHSSVDDVDVMSSLTVAQRILVTNTSFAELQSHYSVLVRSMPDDYMNTVSQLESHLTGDHIGSVLECEDAVTANQRILDCLIAQLDNKEDTFDLCNWLSIITDAPLLTAAIEDLKIDVINGIKMEDAGGTASAAVDVEASLNSLKLNDLSTPRNVLSFGITKTEPDVFNRLEPGRFGPKALEVLKKHFDTLWRCFPDDYMLTLTTMCEVCTVGDGIPELITLLPTPADCNRTILEYIISITKGDDQMMAFCNLMEKFINNTRFSKIISAFKKDCTDIMLQGWFQKFLVRQSNTSPGSDDDDDTSSAQAKVLPSTTKAVTTFRENVAVVTTESSTASDGHPQQDGGDIGAAVIEHLPAGVSVQCRTMLHSYYDTLWQSFPQDHLITLSRLCNLLPVEERLVETVALYPTSHHDVANRRILNATLSNVKRDNELLGFCVLVEKLIANPNRAKMTEKFKSDCMLVMQKKSVDSTGPPSLEQSQDVVEDTGLITDEPIENDSMAFYFCSPKVTTNCITVLRKYYKYLVDCLPEDHFITLSALSNVIRVQDPFFDEVLKCTDSRKANRKILNSLIMMLSDDQDTNGFCNVIRKVIGNKSLTAEFLEFEMDCLKVAEDGSENSPSSYVANSAGAKQCQNLMSLMLQEIKDDLSSEGLVVFKKYCNFFWKSFPKDYSVTLARFCEASSKEFDSDDNIATCSSLEVGNMKIMFLCMFGVEDDNDLLMFGDIMEVIIDNPKLSKIIEVFREECKMAMQKASLSSSSSSSSLSSSVTNTNEDSGSVSAVVTSHVVSSSNTLSNSQPVPSTTAVHHTNVDSTRAADSEATPAATSTNTPEDSAFLKILSSLPTCVSDDAISVLRKYYNVLVDCFREDHIITMSILNSKIYIQEKFFNDIISMTDHRVANQRMLNALMVVIKDDDHMIKFCDAVLDLCSRDKFCNELVEFTRECKRITGKAESVPLVTTSSTSATADAAKTDAGNEPKMLTILSVRRLSPSGVSVVKEHYYKLLKDFPSDHMITLNILCQLTEVSDQKVDKIISCCSAEEGNEEILEYLIFDVKNNNDLIEFCNTIEKIVGDDSAALKLFRIDCLKVLDPPKKYQPSEQSVVRVPSTVNDIASVTSQHPSAVTDNDVAPMTTASSSNEIAIDDTKAALRTFDEHLHLVTLIEPCCIHKHLQAAGLTSVSAITLTNEATMEELLKQIRSSIEVNGAKMFLTFVGLLQNEGRYVILAYHVFSKYQSYGGQGVLTTKVDPSLLASATLSVGELLDQLKWHRKQLQAGLQYQDPMPMPCHYVQRDQQLLDSIVAKLTERDSIQSVGTTVNISGIGGIGKSTLAKALCHDVRLRNYFLDGFLWIRLGPIPLSPAIKLGQLYHQLTNKTDVGNQTFFTDKLQSLVANHLHKLLVIIDDVWEVSDALVYTQVFNGCKIVMTTRRENVNKLIPSKMCITVEPMSEEEAVKLLTYGLPKEVSPDQISMLARKLHYWPLLLKLSRGYLHVHCTEEHRALQQAINHIQEVVKEKELDAFDVDKHKIAVVTTVQCSIEMLTSDELHALQKFILFMGFSMPVPVTLLPTMLKLGEEVTEKLGGRLLQLGLINHCQFIMAPSNKAIPCYEVHPIVAQYVMGHMTFESPVQLVDALDLGDINVISTVLAGGDDSNVPYHCLATVTAIDAIVLPNHIRSMFALIKCLQYEIKNCIKELSNILLHHNKVDLNREVLGFQGSNAIKHAEKLYHVIIEDWRRLHILLVDDKHDEAIEFITDYVKNHPLQMEVTTFTTFIKSILDQCKGSQSLVTEIRSHTDRIVQFYKVTVKKCCEHVRITLRRDLVTMIKSGDVTVEKYQNLLDIHDRDVKLSTNDNP